MAKFTIVMPTHDGVLASVKLEADEIHSFGIDATSITLLKGKETVAIIPKSALVYKVAEPAPEPAPAPEPTTQNQMDLSKEWREWIEGQGLIKKAEFLTLVSKAEVEELKQRLADQSETIAAYEEIIACKTDIIEKMNESAVKAQFWENKATYNQARINELNERLGKNDKQDANQLVTKHEFEERVCKLGKEIKEYLTDVTNKLTEVNRTEFQKLFAEVQEDPLREAPIV